MSDEALILRAKNGDEVAFRRLLVRHRAALKHICRRYYIPGADRDDVWQEALIGLNRAVATYESGRGRSPRSFLCFAVDRHLATALRMSQAQKHRRLNEAFSFDQAVPGTEGSASFIDELIDRRTPDPSGLVDDVETLREVIDAVAKRLTPIERIALIGMLDGTSYVDIAEAQSVTVKAVDNALQRSRRKLSELIAA